MQRSAAAVCVCVQAVALGVIMERLGQRVTEREGAGAPPSMLSAFPTRLFSKSDHMSSSECASECLICLSSYEEVRAHCCCVAACGVLC